MIIKADPVCYVGLKDVCGCGTLSGSLSIVKKIEGCPYMVPHFGRSLHGDLFQFWVLGLRMREKSVVH